MKPRHVRIGGSLGTTHLVAPFGRWPPRTACGLRLDRHWHRRDDGKDVLVACSRCERAAAAIAAAVAAYEALREARRRRRCRTVAGGVPAASPTPAPAHRRAQNPITTEESCRS